MIPVTSPSITAKEIAYCTTAATGTSGQHYWRERFEHGVAEYVGRKYAVAVPHCTHAIHLALAALGVGPGDEVIVPDVTWIGTVAPVVYVGAKPVFVDMLADTWCIDPLRVNAAISDKTKAIIAVDLYGSMECVAEADVPVIEDAAQAIGSERYSGCRAGSLGSASVFSFHGTKTVSTGEGGMLLTDDQDIYQRVLRLQNHGREPGDSRFEFGEVGFKYRMNAVTAALGCAQMERIDKLVAHKRQVFAWYRERLDLPMNAEPAGTVNSYWMTTVFTPKDKFDVQAAMRERGIETRPFFTPLTQQMPFLGWTGPVARRLCPYGLNLPSGADMTEERVETVCAALKAVL